jgi:hypothetical protein
VPYAPGSLAPALSTEEEGDHRGADAHEADRAALAGPHDAKHEAEEREQHSAEDIDRRFPSRLTITTVLR